MFEKMKYRGLVARLAKKIGMDPAGALVVPDISAANYPEGAKAVMPDILYIEPLIPQWEVKKATEDFLDRGMGSLDDLCEAIWGLSVSEYLDKSAELMETKFA